MDIKLDINKALEEIAKGFGVAVEKIYPVLYKQALIDGVVNLLWVVMIIVGVTIYYKYAKFATKRVHEGIQNNESKWSSFKTDWSDYPVYVITLVLGGIASFALVLTGMCLIEDSLTAFLNTEYYMVEKIITQVKE